MGGFLVPGQSRDTGADLSTFTDKLDIAERTNYWEDRQM